jgi:hypothetical protein
LNSRVNVRFVLITHLRIHYLTYPRCPEIWGKLRLNLAPWGNNASLVQQVTATGRSIVLEGGVANGTTGVKQTILVNKSAFNFGTGTGY